MAFEKLLPAVVTKKYRQSPDVVAKKCFSAVVIDNHRCSPKNCHWQSVAKKLTIINYNVLSLFLLTNELNTDKTTTPAINYEYT